MVVRKRQPRFAPDQQMLIVGKNKSGKSVLGLYYLASVQTQAIFVNVKSDPAIVPWARAWYGEQNVSHAIGEVDSLDFQRRVLVYDPRNSRNPEEFDRLYERLLRRRNLFILLDEAFGPTTANRVPDHIAMVLQHGRARNLRHLAITQRPVNIAKPLMTEAHHVVFFPRGFNAHDRKTLAPEMGVSEPRLKVLAASVSDPARFGNYGHLHYEQGANLIHRRSNAPLVL